MSQFHAVLEIGTTRTVLAIGEADRGGRIKVNCHAEIPSAGVRKSKIVDIGQATQSIKSVLKEIERRQSAAGIAISIGNAFLAVTGQHVACQRFQGSVPVAGARVSADDVEAVGRASRGLTLPRERELVDIADGDYELDQLGGISDPKGMSGRVLKLNTLQIHADRNRLDDARTAAAECHLEIRDPFFAPTCAADAVLEDHERKNGVLVLDLGGGSTGYAAYCDGRLAATGALGVGGDHVTNDIAHAFRTTQAQAEILKTREASALVRPEGDRDPRVKLFGTTPLMESRTVSRHALDTVVNARVRELLAFVREKLENEDLLQRLHAGVVLVGGGARLLDIDALAQAELGMPARIGRPLHVDGLEDVEFPSSFATLAGALQYAHANYEERPGLSSFFGRFFS